MTRPTRYRVGVTIDSPEGRELEGYAMVPLPESVQEFIAKVPPGLNGSKMQIPSEADLVERIGELIARELELLDEALRWSRRLDRFEAREADAAKRNDARLATEWAMLAGEAWSALVGCEERSSLVRLPPPQVLRLRNGGRR